MKQSPDPAVGATLTLLGIVLMGITGATNLHFAFNASTGVAMLGAVLFVAAVAITSFRDRRAQRDRE